MSSYIFRDDAAGQEFADALIEAGKRGVAVRVLLDSVGTGYIHPGIFYRLQRGGVTAARFLHTWLPWRMPFLNMRNHRKLLVVDGTLAFMGGINIGAENSARLSGPADFIATCISASKARWCALVMDAFARDWTFTTDETLDEDCWWPELEPGQSCARGLRSGPDADIYRLELILGAALNLAQSMSASSPPISCPTRGCNSPSPRPACAG